MIYKQCFMTHSTKEKCYEQVDVDNCFGHIMDDDVWCPKHAEIGKAYLKAVEIINKQKELEKQKRLLLQELQKPLRHVREHGIIL